MPHTQGHPPQQPQVTRRSLLQSVQDDARQELAGNPIFEALNTVAEHTNLRNLAPGPGGARAVGGAAMRRKPDGAGSTSLKIGKRLFDIATGSNPRGGGDVAVQTAIQSIVSELAFPEETVKFFDELAGVDSEQ